MREAWQRPVGIAVISFATLVHQLLLVRFVSARLLNNYAFLIVSLSMAGFAIGGLLLATVGRRVVERGPRAIVGLFDAYAIALVSAWAIFGRMSVPDDASLGGASDVVSSLAFSIVLALPFVFSGMAVGAYLASEEKTGRLYAFDLGAASIGCVVSIVGVDVLELEFTAALTVLLVVVARLFLAVPRDLVGRAIAGAALLFALVTAAFPTRVFALTPIPGSMLAHMLERGGKIVDVRWDPAARIEITEAESGVLGETSKRWPALTSENPNLLARFRTLLTQNNFAFTLMIDDEGEPSSFVGLDETIYAAAYVAVGARVPNPSSIVIGVGGGFDLLTALAHGAREVTGVEINGATLDILADRYRDAPAHFTRDPRVTLVHSDGRHFIARSDARYDVIQLSGVDSYSGAQGSAHVFSETYLYTVEAMKAYIEHLSDDGVLNVMRLEHGMPREMLRVMTTIVTALGELGYEQPARHIVAVGQVDDAFIAALVSKKPFTQEEVARVRAWTDRVPALSMVADPFHEGEPHGNHEAYLQRVRMGQGASIFDVYPYQIAPATDDWPFFFQFARASHLIDWMRGEREKIERPTLYVALAVLGALLSLLMLLTVVAPLIVFARRGLKVEHPVLHIAYFALLGVGFLVVEVHLMQRLSLLLGGQTMSVTVVLMTLLASSGVGAALSARVFARVVRARSIAYVFALFACALPALEGPLADAIALPLALRIVVAVVATAPLGVLMGLWFPLGLDHLKATAPAFVPWAWGVNGAFSVLAPIFTIACAVTFGQTLTYLVAVPIYLVVGALADRLDMRVSSVRRATKTSVVP